MKRNRIIGELCSLRDWANKAMVYLLQLILKVAVGECVGGMELSNKRNRAKFPAEHGMFKNGNKLVEPYCSDKKSSSITVSHIYRL